MPIGDVRRLKADLVGLVEVFWGHRGRFRFRDAWWSSCHTERRRSFASQFQLLHLLRLEP
jgi:hypothetical protein